MHYQLLLLLIPAAASGMPAAEPLPAFPAADSSKYCSRTATIPYQDQWGSIFIEHTYTCDFPRANKLLTQPGNSPLHYPAQPDLTTNPASPEPALRDPTIAILGALEPSSTAAERARQQAAQKLTIPHYGCDLLPAPARLDQNRYSNLFWALRQLTNQTCVDPGEVKEFVDVHRTWTADWRFMVANRGNERRCEWWQEVANIAEALHYVCYFSEVGTGAGERSGGQEAVAWGREGGDGLRWCMRYSKRGWGEDLWEERCLGV